MAIRTGGLDPGLFRPEAVDAETAAFNAELEARLATIPAVYALPVEVTRRAREAGKGPFGPIVRSELARERRIPGPAGEITLRCFLPETVAGVYLSIHGGGFALGAAHHQDPRLEAIARHCRVAVVSVE